MKSERFEAIKEAEKDLEKPIDQLLADIHEEMNNEDRSLDENIAHAQKRFFSLVANVAESNNKLAKRVFILTVIAVAFTVIQLIPALIQAFIWLSKQG